MTLYYSARTGGFYDSHLHKTLPHDAIEISTQTHQALLKDNAQGAQIEANAEGYPQAVFPTQNQMLALAKEAALARLTDMTRSQLQQAIGASDESEIMICLYQYRTALAIQAGTATQDEQTAFEREIEACALNESLESFCTDVLNKGARLMQIIGITQGLKHRAAQTINQASSQAEIETCEQDFKSRLTLALASVMEHV